MLNERAQGSLKQWPASGPVLLPTRRRVLRGGISSEEFQVQLQLQGDGGEGVRDLGMFLSKFPRGDCPLEPPLQVSTLRGRLCSSTASEVSKGSLEVAQLWQWQPAPRIRNLSADAEGRFQLR